MAENKKSFVLYVDIIHTFEELTDEEAGKLIKHILKYVNDLNPIAEDKITKIAFEPIKQQLKRDLRKYETIIEKRSAAGKKSAELRNNKSQQVLTSVNTINLCSTNPTDSVNDNVNVNEINNISITQAKAGDIDFDKFINLFNSFADRKFRLNAKIKKDLISRRKEYSANDILIAIRNAHNDRYHIETKFKYLTPEFILRREKLERFLNQDNLNETKSQGYTPVMPN
tara:strand:- start:780 stop:1460 length:681 start_codon:yes stop_codon:yes gene_type:complete